MGLEPGGGLVPPSPLKERPREEPSRPEGPRPSRRPPPQKLLFCLVPPVPNPEERSRAVMDLCQLCRSKRHVTAHVWGTPCCTSRWVCGGVLPIVAEVVLALAGVVSSKCHFGHSGGHSVAAI